MREGDDLSSALTRLIGALEGDLEWRDMHARLRVRTHEWINEGFDRSYLLHGRRLLRVVSGRKAAVA